MQSSLNEDKSPTVGGRLCLRLQRRNQVRDAVMRVQDFGTLSFILEFRGGGGGRFHQAYLPVARILTGSLRPHVGSLLHKETRCMEQGRGHV